MENPYRRRKRTYDEIKENVDAEEEGERKEVERKEVISLDDISSQMEDMSNRSSTVIEVDSEEEEEDEGSVQMEGKERGEGEEGGDDLFENFEDFERILRVPINEELTDEEVLDLLDTWKSIWVMDDANRFTSSEILQRAERLFPIQNNEGEENLSMCKEYMVWYTETLSNLRNVAQVKGLLESKDEEDRAPAERLAYFELILNGIIFGYESRSNILRIKHLSNSQCIHAIPTTFESIQKLVLDPSDKTLDDTSKYMKFLYMTAWQRLYRIKEEILYQPKFYNGIYTYAWVKAHDLDSFIWNAFQPRSLNEEMWRCVTSRPSVATQAKKQLMNTNDPMLPQLKQYHGSWSFKNGVYVGKVDKFYRYGCSQTSDFSTGFATVKFFPLEFEKERYDRIMYGQVYNDFDDEEEQEEQEEKNDDGDMLDLAELKGEYEYNDNENDDGNNDDDDDFEMNSWMKLPTPKIDKILDDQELSLEVKQWVWVFLGRLLFPVGLHDSWQVMPFFEGIAGSGKSTLLKVIQMFFDPEDVGILTDQIEKEFGAEGLYLKKVILGFDIGKKLGLSQVEWQSWVSGEACQIKRKFKTALSIQKWTTPMAFAGNNIPMWNDNAGSVSRRFMIIEMMKAVRNVDTSLFTEIGQNLAMILKKMILSYLSACHEYGSVGLHRVVPQEFLDSANRLRKATNALYAFVDSPLVHTKNMDLPDDQQPVLVQSMDSFHNAYKQFCSDKRYPYKRLEPDYVCDVFARFGIRLEKEYQAPHCEPGEYLIGCMLAE